MMGTTLWDLHVLAQFLTKNKGGREWKEQQKVEADISKYLGALSNLLNKFWLKEEITTEITRNEGKAWRNL